MNTRIFSLREIMVVETLLGGTKRHHEMDNSDSEKELVSSTNSNLPPFESQIVIVAPSLEGWNEVKRKTRKKGKIKDYFINGENKMYIINVILFL
jgi:hypothetical protein